MNCLNKTTFLLLVCWLSRLPAMAQDTIFIDRHLPEINVTSHCVWMHDSLRQAAPWQNDAGFVWKKQDGEVFQLEKPGRYSLKFFVKNTDSADLHLLLHSASMDVKAIRAFVQTAVGVDATKEVGCLSPISRRPMKNADLQLSLHFFPRQLHVCYVYLERGATPLQVNLGLFNPAAPDYRKSEVLTYLHKGFTMGIALVYFLTGLLVWLVFPQKLHAAYFVYVTGAGGYLAASMGVGMTLFWSELPYFEELAAEFFATIQFMGLFVMSRIVLQTRSRYPWADKLLVFTLMTGVGYLIVGFSRAWLPVEILVYASVAGAATLALSILVVTGISFLNFWRFKAWESLWFFSVFAFTMGFALVMLLTEFGFVRRTDFINGILPNLSILVEATLSMLFVSWRIARQMRERQLAEMVMQEQRRLELERISRDLHDEIGSTLSSISILGEATSQRLSAGGGKEQLSVIGERARQAMDMMSDIVWSVNPRNDRLEAVMQRMREFGSETLEAKNVALHFSCPETLHSLRLPMEMRQNFYLIFKETVNNVAKHAEAKNTWVKADFEHGKVSLKIADDGKGYDPAQAKNGNGLRNLHVRAERLGGNLRLESSPGGGARLFLSFVVPI